MHCESTALGEESYVRYITIWPKYDLGEANDIVDGLKLIVFYLENSNNKLLTRMKVQTTFSNISFSPIIYKSVHIQAIMVVHS